MQISSNTTVLVLSRREKSSLVENLFSIGMVPIVRQTMPDALKAVQHESPVAVFVDSDHGSVDPLEFTLNIRDISAETPVFLMREAVARTDEKTLQALRAVRVTRNSPAALRAILAQHRSIC